MSPMNTHAKTRRTANTNIMDRKLVRHTSAAQVPFIKQSVVPAGRYTAQVTAVKSAQTVAGEDAIDIIYDLTDAKGKVIAVRERYSIDSYLLDKFIDHLFDNQLLPDNATYADIVGIVETVDISYVNPKSLGSMANRKPCMHTASKTTPSKKTSAPSLNDTVEDESDENLEEDLDDECDDFLVDEDEDDL